MSTDPSPPSSGAREVPWRQVGAVLVGLEALVPAAAAVVLVVQVATGHGVVARNELMVAAFCLLAAGGLAAVALGVRAGRRGARTPGVFLQVLVLGTLRALWQAGQPVVAVLLVLLALATGYAVVRATAQPAD